MKGSRGGIPCGISVRGVSRCRGTGGGGSGGGVGRDGLSAELDVRTFFISRTRRLVA